MSPAMWGALAGAILAGLNMILLWNVAREMERKSKGQAGQRTVGILKTVALVDLVLFPVLGYYIGSMVL